MSNAFSLAISGPHRESSHGSTFSEPFEATKDAHDNECFCQLPLGDHAWVPTGKAADAWIDEEVSKLSAEGCATVAWFFDSEYSDGTRHAGSEGSSSDALFSTSPTSPSSLATRVGSKYSEDSCGIPGPIKLSQGIFKTDCNESTLPSCSLTAYQSSPGAVWVDRTSCLLGLHKRWNFDPGFVLVHRPAGFGKTSFLAMAEFFRDVKHRDSPAPRSALLSTWIGDFCAANTYAVNLHADLVLTFDLPRHA
ncbi:hypothetical protein ARMSODRAFT_1021302 [Armillaria solidipes]|uniref:AAA-ATPase-like domain-containing protein n=1 Tax=Armillaria solidipes TaxID=1076256 RepID=A0A2H3BPK7_9AGAR|nr:hypothetical protein ARMSODRAFT_1021302 [Armillaria solidipes]